MTVIAVKFLGGPLDGTTAEVTAAAEPPAHIHAPPQDGEQGSFADYELMDGRYDLASGAYLYVYDREWKPPTFQPR